MMLIICELSWKKSLPLGAFLNRTQQSEHKPVFNNLLLQMQKYFCWFSTYILTRERRRQLLNLGSQRKLILLQKLI